MTDREFTASSRPLDVPGVQNFRDAAIGGLRPGRLYRSGHLGLLTPDGAKCLDELGIRTVIDLRTITELSILPDRRHSLDFDLYHHPVLPDRESTGLLWPEGQAEMYLFMPEAGGLAIADTVRRLAAPGSLPALVHCAVGKDRTGISVAIVQSLTGASESEIVADFLRSNPSLGLDTGPVGYIDEYGEERLSLPVVADHLLATLARLRALHGSLEGYLHAHGVTADELSALRHGLTA